MEFFNGIEWLPIIQYVIRILGVFIVLTAGWLVSGWAHRMVLGSLQRTRIDVTLTKFTANLARWGVIIIAFFLCFEIFGIQTTSFAAVLAAAGFAVGLAFQGSLSNFAAGVLLLTFRPFKVGDSVQIDQYLGRVDEIDLIMTTVDTFDNRHVTIPNSTALNSIVVNLNYHDRRRADVPVGVSYSANIDATREALLKAASNVPNRLPEFDPVVILTGFGDSSVDWEVRVWGPATEWIHVRHETVRAIKIALDEAGISIPFPQLDIHLNNEVVQALAQRQGGSAKLISADGEK